MNQTAVGIDVGNERKGFHAVALRDGKFLDKMSSIHPPDIVSWCLDHNARVVAADAPCRWSENDLSRLAERELMKNGIWCFSTPTKQKANLHDFYKWMLNGEKLYECLESHQFARFDGERTGDLICIETFPHAIICALEGRVVPTKPKIKKRREALLKEGYDIDTLSNIDFVDAALCAIAANDFRKDNYKKFGDRKEGFIIVPASSHKTLKSELEG